MTMNFPRTIGRKSRFSICAEDGPCACRPMPGAAKVCATMEQGSTCSCDVETLDVAGTVQPSWSGNYASWASYGLVRGRPVAPQLVLRHIAHGDKQAR